MGVQQPLAAGSVLIRIVNSCATRMQTESCVDQEAAEERGAVGHTATGSLTHNGKPPPLAVRLEEVRPSRRAVLVDGLHQRTTTCELKETVIGE